MTLKIKADKIIDLPKFGFVDVYDGKIYQKKCNEISKISILEITSADRVIKGYAKNHKRQRAILNVKRLKPQIKDLIKAEMVEVE